jgi:hypothetical protein
MSKPKVEVTDAPDVDTPPAAEPGPYISEQTRAEQELGRKTAEANGLALATAQARRADEERSTKENDAEREAATRGAGRVGVFPHAADQQVKP